MKQIVLLVALAGIFIQSSNCAQQKKVLTGNDGAGSVWPMPKKMTTTKNVIPVAVDIFTFQTTKDSKTCTTMTNTFQKYEKLIRTSLIKDYKLKFRPAVDTSLSTLQVTLTSECEAFPSIDMDESYTLTIQEERTLKSNSVWGIIRGLETFSQILRVEADGEVVVNETFIEDEPRFKHRGVLIDTARHYIPLMFIFQVLDGMAFNKMNVLHWHIVDDQAFPYYSSAFPDLSGKGAYNAGTHVYTPNDVISVIYYAKDLGIRVIPEFDTPGHSLSWGKSQKGLLTECYSNGKFNGNYGPINPTNEGNYDFIKNLWTELRQVFTDKYIHLGGDEVNFYCWSTNPQINAWMKTNNITDGDYAKVEQYHIQKVINISNEVGFSYIVWQEVIDNGVEAKKDTVVEVWLPPANKEVEKVTKMGYQVLIAQPWYLDYISYGKDWETYYKYEPLNFTGTDEQKKLVLGGEACLWSEYVDSTNLLSRMWPRASAVAERLWSPANVNNTEEATPRLHQQRCRMLKRNIPAEPLWIGHCDYEWQNY